MLGIHGNSSFNSVYFRYCSMKLIVGLRVGTTAPPRVCINISSLLPMMHRVLNGARASGIVTLKKLVCSNKLKLSIS